MEGRRGDAGEIKSCFRSRHMTLTTQTGTCKKYHIFFNEADFEVNPPKLVGNSILVISRILSLPALPSGTGESPAVSLQNRLFRKASLATVSESLLSPFKLTQLLENGRFCWDCTPHRLRDPCAFFLGGFLLLELQLR